MITKIPEHGFSEAILFEFTPNYKTINRAYLVSDYLPVIQTDGG